MSRGVARDVEAGHVSRPQARRQERRQHLEPDGLSRAVHGQQSEDLAGLQRDRQGIDGREVAKRRVSGWVSRIGMP